MQKKTRLDIEFEGLTQGGLSHADFRALWESKLEDWVEAKMDMPTADTLYRKYLCKLNAELRRLVLSKDWRVDGEDNPPRKCKTWEDGERMMEEKMGGCVTKCGIGAHGVKEFLRKKR